MANLLPHFPLPRHRAPFCHAALALFATLWWAGQAMAVLPSVVDLNVTPGNESAPVWRVSGDDSDDGMGGDNPGALAVGDVNGDGYDDLVVGVTNADQSTRTNAGEVYVLYGKGTLPDTQTNLNTNGDISAAGETRILGAESGNLTGRSVACGDINADGFDDVVIGIEKADHTSPIRTDAGAVVVIFGAATLPATTLNLNNSATEDLVWVIRADDEGDALGRALAVGDVNADGYDDVIAGAYLADPAGGASAGEVYVVYGNSSRKGTVTDLNATPGSRGETRILGDDADDLLGFAVAVGDVNGDGVDDVVAGAPGARQTSGFNAGEVVVAFGRSDLSGDILDLNSAPGTSGELRILGDDGGGTSTALGDNLGFSIATGDVDGDGSDDIVAGAYGASNTDGAEAGEVYVIYGANVSGITVVDLDTNGAVSEWGETRFVGVAGGDQTGWAVATGDIDGDGLADVVAGVRQGDPAGGGDAGSVAVLYSIDFPRAAVVDLAATGPSISLLGDKALDLLGSGVASGFDMNRDGFADFAGSAFQGDNTALTVPAGGNNNTGTIAVVFGDGYDDDSNDDIDSATATLGYSDGKTLVRGFGGRLSPVVRTWLGFDAGTAALATSTVHRSDPGFTTLPSGHADVSWFVGTAREDWSKAYITFQYLDSEIDGLTEANLALYWAPALDKPWTEIPSSAVNLERNEVSATVEELGYFILASDTTPPVISISPPSHGITRTGPVTFTVSYEGADSISLDTGDITLATTGTATAKVAVSGSGSKTRTVTLSTAAGDGTLGISIAAGTAVDLAGHLAPAAGPSATVVVDNTAPGIDIGAPSAPTSTGGPITYAVTYTGGDLNGITLASANVRLNATGTATGEVSVSGNPGATRTVTIDQIQGEGTLGISIVAGTAFDIAGNLAHAAGPSQTFAVDATGPTLAIGAPSETTTITGPVSFEVTYTGASNVTLAPNDVMLVRTGSANGTVSVSGSGATTRTVTVSDITGVGSLAIQIAEGSASDAENRLAPAAGPSESFAVTNAGGGGVGDVNEDGAANALDVQLVVNAVLGIPIEGNPDVNGDGSVNAQDIQIVVNAVLGVL